MRKLSVVSARHVTGEFITVQRVQAMVYHGYDLFISYLTILNMNVIKWMYKSNSMTIFLFKIFPLLTGH